MNKIYLFSIFLFLGVNAAIEESNESDLNIIIPENNKIYAAGDIDFKFQIIGKPTNFSPIQILIDGQKVGETTNLVYTYFITKVKFMTLTVKTRLDNGREIEKSVRFGITKKGIGANEDMGRHLNLKDFHAGWYFNWGNKPSQGSQYDGIEFVPMLWGERFISEAEKNINDLISQGYKYVFLFNEPDRGDQCNMPVRDVYQIYKYAFENKNIQKSAPMTSVWPADSFWFKDWVIVATDVKTDFIVLHIYPDNFGGAAMADWLVKTIVDGTWNTYHKNIWINEFSTVGDIITEQSTIEFYKAVIPMLNEREYVVRYSPFAFDNKPYSLWNKNTGEITAVGRVYAETGNPE